MYAFWLARSTHAFDRMRQDGVVSATKSRAFSSTLALAAAIVLTIAFFTSPLVLPLTL